MSGTRKRKDISLFDCALACLRLAWLKPDEARWQIEQAASLIRKYKDSVCSPLSLCVREDPDLDSRGKRLSLQNLDWVWHRFGDPDFLMLVEEKHYGSLPSYAQRDTLQKLHQMMRTDCTVTNERGKKSYAKYLGLHYLIFDKSGVHDSKAIRWVNERTDRVIDYGTLKQLIKFEICPYTLLPLQDGIVAPECFDGEVL